jgi:glycosyltransferase involved in cell wall biosynthesis
VRDHWPVCFYGTALADAPCPGCLVGTRSPCNERRGSPAAPRIARRAKAMVMRRTLDLRARVLRDAAAVTAVSHAIGSEIGPLLDPARLHIIPNAFDEAMIARATLPGDLVLPERFFLYAGKLSPHKGADILPALVRALPRDAPPLVVVGEGALAQTLRATDPTGTRIRLLGQVANTTVLALMARSVAYLFPSRWAEPLSRTPIEAQMMGCPVVATATGGTAETVIDGETGFLTAPDDVAAMARHLTALATDTALRQRMATAAYERTRATYALPAIAARVEAVYRAVQSSAP